MLPKIISNDETKGFTIFNFVFIGKHCVYVGLGFEEVLHDISKETIARGVL